MMKSVFFFLMLSLSASAQSYTSPLLFVEYNCENLFDCKHDSLKRDDEFLPDGIREWNYGRYYKKLNDIGRAIIGCGGKGTEWRLPDIVALTEIENDNVMMDLTRRSILGSARYNYLMTNSPDRRGIDVALLYNPQTFSPQNYYSISVPRDDGNGHKFLAPTRDILYVRGHVRTRDTLHVIVVHAPSRSGGQAASQPYRMHVARLLRATCDSIFSISPKAKVIMAGDFNDYAYNQSLKMLTEESDSLSEQTLFEVSQNAVGRHVKETKVRGTYKFSNRWESLDHILLSKNLQPAVKECYILDDNWLLQEDTSGGKKPYRTFLGTYYQGGVSDHLPLVLRLLLTEEQ
jgi:endonuclease/exonuclease/phosphatase family metal-dependent hydrolase